MEKNICFLMLLLLSSKIFAYANNHDIQPIYCPESITCSFNGYIDSCKIEYISDSKYFGKLSAEGKISGYTLSFASASAGFHSISGGTCRYEYNYKAGGNTHLYVLTLNIKPESNLEAYYQQGSMWNFSQTATCKASSAEHCPLSDRNGFVLHNVNISDGIIITANGKNLTDATNPSGYASITDEDAFLACGNVTKCRLDLVSRKSLKYGSMIIDMESMRILETTSSFPGKIQIKKIDIYNSVAISYPPQMNPFNFSR